MERDQRQGGRLPGTTLPLIKNDCHYLALGGSTPGIREAISKGVRASISLEREVVDLYQRYGWRRAHSTLKIAFFEFFASIRG